MAAGQGFKDFTTGEVLTAADVDGYLMQGVWVFASAAARDAAVTSPQEGNFAYLKDTNVTTYYTGSAWANLDTTGMTNPMTTTGDTIYSSSGSTPARLGIGTAGQVLTVNSGATAPEWKTAAGGGGLVLIQRSTFSSVANTGTTFDSIFTSTYKAYQVIIEEFYCTTASDDAYLNLMYSGTVQSANYFGASGGGVYNSSTFNNIQISNTTQITLDTDPGDSSNSLNANLLFSKVGNSSQRALITGTVYSNNSNTARVIGAGVNSAQTYTGFRLSSSSSNISGTVAIYGWKTT